MQLASGCCPVQLHTAVQASRMTCGHVPSVRPPSQHEALQCQGSQSTRHGCSKGKHENTQA